MRETLESDEAEADDPEEDEDERWPGSLKDTREKKEICQMISSSSRGVPTGQSEDRQRVV